MEQARCWMWPKRKLDLMMSSSPHHHHHHHHLLTYPASANPSSSSNGDSWEEQAFAEDAAGALGGCVWPPRSYTCSFCRREFRSAQALGGHMNVHRRDRARLKQSSPPEGEGGNNSNHVVNPTVPLEAQYTPPRGSSGGTLLYNHNSPDSDHWITVSTNVQEQYKNTNDLSAWSTLSGFGLTKDVKNGEKKELKVLIDLRKNTTSIEDEAENNLKILDSSFEVDVSSCKRRKINSYPTFGLLTSKPDSEILSNPIEELDLELRLGSDPPKVK